MAHPCINCGSECYCNGDIDDCIVNKIPLHCGGCGCEDSMEDDLEDEEDYYSECWNCPHPDICEGYEHCEKEKINL